ncbi:MAG: 3-keto-5-aminohexanoate cleavage protein [Deltaproteobacteria bacterium]|nr:3-keto-5-aminohexanoate cleavage protein [Deltaproteobacteria bacterium]
MGKDKVNWEYINEWKKDVNPLGKKEDFKAIGFSFGLPEIIDPIGTRYGVEVEVQPQWQIPRKALICQTIVGALYSRRGNPHQPIEPEKTREQALACLEAGAPNVHIHVRDQNGYNTLDPELFHFVIDPIRKAYPDRIVCGCMVPNIDGDWEKFIECCQDGLFDQTPINTTATFLGDTAFVKPPHVIIEKTRICQELGVKPQIAVYSDGDIDNADRYLIKTGVLEKPYYWIVLPALPGGSPMHSPKAMVEVLMHYCNRIKEIDEDSQIVVCASGRASSYLSTFALLLGHHIRIGMEDTVWRWPHRNEMITHNLETFKAARTMLNLLGRELVTPDEWRELLGMRKPGGTLKR